MQLNKLQGFFVSACTVCTVLTASVCTGWTVNSTAAKMLVNCDVNSLHVLQQFSPHVSAKISGAATSRSHLYPKRLVSNKIPNVSISSRSYASQVLSQSRLKRSCAHPCCCGSRQASCRSNHPHIIKAQPFCPFI